MIVRSFVSWWEIWKTSTLTDPSFIGPEFVYFDVELEQIIQLVISVSASKAFYRFPLEIRDLVSNRVLRMMEVF